MRGSILKWFKHYTNAHKGGAIQVLRPHFSKAEAYGLYFLFTEYLADKWDGSGEPIFKVFRSDLSSFLGLKQKKLDLFLVCLRNESKISWEDSADILTIKFPKLLEIKHKDALSSRHRQASGPATGGQEEEENRTDKMKKRASSREFLKSVPIITKDIWINTYGQDFLDEYIAEALAYYATEPASKNWNTQVWVSKVGSSLKRSKTHLEAEAKKIRTVPETGGWAD